MHLSRVYCLLLGPPTTSNCPAVPISRVKHSGLLSMQSSVSSVCVHCARDQRVWLTRGDLRTSLTGMPGNGSEQSLCPKIVSLQIWCLTGCVSDDYKRTGNTDDQLIHHSAAPGPPWSRHRWCQSLLPVFLSWSGYCNVLAQWGHFNYRETFNPRNFILLRLEMIIISYLLDFVNTRSIIVWIPPEFLFETLDMS